MKVHVVGICNVNLRAGAWITTVAREASPGSAWEQAVLTHNKKVLNCVQTNSSAARRSTKESEFL